MGNHDKENKDVSKIFEMLADHDNKQNSATGKATTNSIFTRVFFPFLIAFFALMAVGNGVSTLIAVLSILGAVSIGLVWAIIHDNTGRY